MFLVTGAAGFVGSHLIRALSAAGMPARALYRNTPPDAVLTALPDITWQHADLLDIYDVAEALQGITHIYHCAAAVSFQATDKEMLLHNNVSATENLINAALDAGVEKLVHLSSVAALGRNAHSRTISEEAEWSNEGSNSAYAISKYRAEMEVWRGMAEGLNAAIVNPGIILGEGDWDKGSAALMKVVWKEFPWYTGGTNSFVDVADVVRAMMLLMGSSIQEERFILSAGNFSYKDIFTQMATALGKRPPHKHAVSGMTELIWRAERIKSMFTGKAPVVTRETARTAQQQCFYSNEKLLTAFPEFSYTPISDTIARMAACFLKQHDEKPVA